MSFKDKVKNSSFLFGLYHFYNDYLRNYKKSLGLVSNDTTLGRPIYISGPENVYFGPNTGVGKNSTILATNARFIMKGNCGAAGGLFVATGNHERRIGRFYRTITELEKNKDLDKDVIVEEDCWIGGNVSLLAGVILKRGCTIANGAVVTRSTVPYSVWGGVPAKFIKFYWTIDQILEHESKLYAEEERFTKKQLEEIFAKYQK